MSEGRSRLRRILASVVLVALIASACGDDAGDADAQAVSQAAGTQGDIDLSLVVNELEAGFGALGRSRRQAVQGVIDAGEDCGSTGGDRARPLPSQVEVEIISVVDDCLVFSYDVANFRTVVADVQAIRDRDGVIAASPLLLDYRLNQIDSAWSLDAVDAGAFVAQPNSPTGSDIVVAVIDSGIDATHPGLANASIRRAPESGVGDYAETGHGTVAAAIMVSPIGSAGRAIAPNVELLDVPADLCGPDECGCDPCAPMTPAEAIRWSVDNGAHVISMSFGFTPAPKPAWWELLLDGQEINSTLDTMAVSLAYARGSEIAMVAAAGNCAGGPSDRCESEDQFEIPAGHPGVMGVAATAPDEAGVVSRAWYSTRQSYVEIAAPGSLQMVGADGDLFEKNGTSYATPFIAASIAVLIGSDGPLADESGATEMARSILADTAADLGPDGLDDQSGHGQLQLGAALLAANDP